MLAEVKGPDISESIKNTNVRFHVYGNILK
jgi:hypothetical protein